jgi:DivIVA domain-containing protein
VDAVLVRVEAGIVPADDVRQTKFHSVLTGGYDEREVEEALDAAVRWLEAGGPTGSEAVSDPILVVPPAFRRRLSRCTHMPR